MHYVLLQILAKSAKFHNAKGAFERSKGDLVPLASTIEQKNDIVLLLYTCNNILKL